jgi:hypothetical protein
MLQPKAAEKGKNFLPGLSEELLQLARARLSEKPRGAIEEYRLLHNLLSSQPMAFNLFAAMDKGHSLEAMANRLFGKLVQDEKFSRIRRVRMEFAPRPAKEYLSDRTAFDAFVEYERSGGKLGFVGIETKLTEAFSPKEYDTKVYRDLMKLPGAPFQGPVEALRSAQVNQLWRGHLLMGAMLAKPKSPYSYGHFMVVYHPEDLECVEAIQAYRKLLKPEDPTFLDLPLDQLFEQYIEFAAQTRLEGEWAERFQERYLFLVDSQTEWEGRRG